MVNLQSAIKEAKAKIAVVGMGYVGLPLALAIARSGFDVTGIDLSDKRVKMLKKNKSYIDDISHDELKEIVSTCKVKFTSSYSVVKKMDCIIVCVPTPLGKTKEPDLSYILASMTSISKFLKRGQLIILESTTYPGTTEESIAPYLKKKTGLSAEKDYYLGFSPERVDPANKKYQIVEIPKVVGGVGEKSKKLIQTFYEKIFRKVIPVSSSRAAEMVKLLENTFRSVNIGLINEMALICDTLKIDIWEVIEAAKSKPFGFMPFYPGPGIGGHCINIDSMYLAWKVRLHGYEPRLIELAQTINDRRPYVIVERVTRVLNTHNKSVRNSRVFILGVAYKKNVRDMRESPAVTIVEELKKLGAKVRYHDPYVPSIKLESGVMKSVPISSAHLSRHDIVLILTDHDNIDYGKIASITRPVLDTRNAMRKYPGRSNVFRL